jgi:hypothetical protein
MDQRIIVSDAERHQATNQPDGANTVIVDGTVYNTSGKDGGADAGDASKTGFYQKKFWDETLTDMNMGKSENSLAGFPLGGNLFEPCRSCVLNWIKK